MKPIDPHHKFSLDRISLFSDAVFAIAITLLIIEVKVPDIGPPFTDDRLLFALQHEIGKFVGVLVSFLIIGRYWLFHHRLFGHVTSFNGALLWTNLFFLFSIVIMPFSTAIYSEYFIEQMSVPVLIYAINICFTGLMNIRLISVVSNPKYHLSQGLGNKRLLRFFKVRSMLAPLLFVFAFVLTVFHSPWAYYLPVFFPLVSWGVNKYYRKKHPEFFEDPL